MLSPKFAGLTNERDQPPADKHTDAQTDHVTPCVAIGRYR